MFVKPTHLNVNNFTYFIALNYYNCYYKYKKVGKYMDKKKIIISYVIATTMILGILGYTFAYFNANVTENNKTETVIKTNELNIIFTGTNEITTGDNMIPGDSFTKTFTVENTSSVKTSYNIYMEGITNEFNEDLVYVLSDETGIVVTETPLPTTNTGKTYLLENIEIESGLIKEYTLKIEFKYLDTSQNDYQDKIFNATLGIDANKIPLENYIKVDATDSQGNNLNATASNITGDEKENLLTSLEETGYITNKDEVDALIEVESDDFNDLATTTFDVSSIAKSGDTVVILHFDEEKQEWEYIGTETVDEDGKIRGDFTSYSPVAFVVVKEDGTYENIISNNIVVAYTYNQTNGASNYCVTGNESTCKETKCYELDADNSCAAGTIVDYKVNDTDTVRFHVMYDNGTTLTMQSQKNTVYNVAWYEESSNASGPLTILPVLESKTSNWTNVNTQTYTMGITVFKTNNFTGCSSYSSCTENIYTLAKRTANARMITLQETTNLGCANSVKTCPIWMYNYLSDSISYGGTINDTTTENESSVNDGYWTMSATIETANKSWFVRYRGGVTTQFVTKNSLSARAVVEINK